MDCAKESAFRRSDTPQHTSAMVLSSAITLATVIVEYSFSSSGSSLIVDRPSKSKFFCGAGFL